MSLFENEQYRWRETYFVLFDARHRPAASAVKKAIEKMGSRYELSDLQHDAQGRFESLTLISPYDFAAMDVTYVDGEDVVVQAAELRRDMKSSAATKEERAKIRKLEGCDARLDVYHFERLVDDQEEEEEEFLDPGALLIVLEQLTRLCRGVSVDPQSGALM